VPDIVPAAYAQGEFEAVVRNIRESSLGTMRARGQIDDAQLRAGEWFRATYERMRMGSMAIDPQKEPVDTSGFADPIPDRIIKAGQDLAAARAVLGPRGYMVCELVCGQGFGIQEVPGTWRSSEGTGWRLRNALDDLAEWRGFATARK